MTTRRTADGTGPSPGYAVTLLGSFRLDGPDGPVQLTAREQRVVALLALHGPQQRAVVAGMLWPETDEHRARQNLRAAVATLARLAPGALRASKLALEVDASVDVRDFVAVAQDVLRAASWPADADGTGGPATGTAQLAALCTALVGDGPFAGDLLPGWYDDWVLVEAERLRHLRLHTLEGLSALLSAAARYGLALEVALAAVALDPLRESAHRAVIEVHACEGNVATALAQHERFRTRLARELHITPSPQMEALVARLRRRPGTDPTPGRPSWPQKSPARTART